MDVSSFVTKNYNNEQWTANNERLRKTKPNKPNSNPISDYPCIFELAVYNLVLRDGNFRNFNGEKRPQVYVIDPQVKKARR